jgi:hypothetical protein
MAVRVMYSAMPSDGVEDFCRATRAVWSALRDRGVLGAPVDQTCSGTVPGSPTSPLLLTSRGAAPGGSVHPVVTNTVVG